ncbi:hypothetical protein GH811_00255 [Acetobacterium malicum]|uniref:Uncharacterized protein n=1 Tax=Acetobacterium malicum TaxID=52692 RepID=A0ABR6YS83_9FIRM|nr:Ig domain-containing protein [Acetobacterium malicum]MBC3898043.1 hypothetical protein [Acetobacterium malicum]
MRRGIVRLLIFLLVLPIFYLLPTAVWADATPSVSYCTHVENVGWQYYSPQGEMSGTEGRGLRLEGIRIALDESGYDLGIEYQTHIQNIGWETDTAKGWTTTNGISGTEGMGYRLEAIQIRLTGADADQFDVYYQVHAQNYGWLDWAKNGEEAGTEGFGYRLEGICIKIIPAGSQAPGDVDDPFVSTNEFLNKIKGNWNSLKNPTTYPGLKINGNPYEECGLLWLGSKYYECRYRIIYVAQDCKSGTFEAYEQNYYKPPSSENQNWQKVPIVISHIYQLNEDNTISRTSGSYSETFKK